MDERKLEKGDLLLNSSGVGTAGRVTFFDLEGDFVVDSHISILRFDRNLLNPKFALYIFYWIGFKNLEDLALGQSGQVEISYETIANFRIPLAPQTIQEKVISEISAIEESEKVVLERLVDLNFKLSQIFSNLNYPIEKLGSLAEFKNGINYSERSKGDLITMIGVKDFLEDFSPDLNQLVEVRIDGKLNESYKLMPGDILVVRSNGSANLVGRFIYINKLLKDGLCHRFGHRGAS